ncbi:energy transducer TonB [Pseudomonas sp. SIMBA_077]
MVKPEYPKELRRQGLEGEVRVRVAVNADGTVSDPKIVYSTHSLFAGAVLKVIDEWRFASRPPASDDPEQLIVFVPLLFELESKQRAQQGDQPYDLATITCLELNKEVNEYVRSELNIPLADLTVFRFTQKQLIDGLVSEKYSSEQLSVGLYDLSQGMVKVAKVCKRKKTRLYADQLPPSVKALLVSGGLAIKTE